MECYAAYAKDINVRKAGSSGGLFPVISKRYIEDGAVVYASVYNDDFSVRFDRIVNLELLERAFTSKYVQSDASYVYEKVKDDILEKKSVLFCGTPCQVNALQRYLRIKKVDTESLLTVDVICHGVPSFLLLELYLKTLPNKGLISLNMRNKDNGWNWGNYSWEFIFEDGERRVIKQSEIPFMKAFLSNAFLRYSCYDCKSKPSEADITLGDFWGISNTNLKVDDRYGVSCVIVNTEKGERVFADLADQIEFMNAEFKDISKFNSALTKSVNKPHNRKNAYNKLIKAKDANDFMKQISHKTVLDRGVSKVYRSIPHNKTKQNLFSSTQKNMSCVQKCKEDCCGCMACISVCPKKAIRFQNDQEGFAYSVIDKTKCINCGLCIKVCPQSESERKE